MTASQTTVRLTEAQAEAIEYAHANGGRYYAPTRTGLGRVQDIRKAEALAEKGVFALVEHAAGEDVYELTDLGRRVYETHPKVIRR